MIFGRCWPSDPLLPLVHTYPWAISWMRYSFRYWKKHLPKHTCVQQQQKEIKIFLCCHGYVWRKWIGKHVFYSFCYWKCVYSRDPKSYSICSEVVANASVVHFMIRWLSIDESFSKAANSFDGHDLCGNPDFFELGGAIALAGEFSDMIPPTMIYGIKDRLPFFTLSISKIFVWCSIALCFAERWRKTSGLLAFQPL